MSLICYKPPGTLLPKEALSKSFEKNSDGAGYSYCHNGIIFTKKGFKSFDTLFASLEKIQEHPCLITFADKDFTLERVFIQPFKIDENHIVAFDGRLSPRSQLEDTAVSQAYNFTLLLKRIWNPIFIHQDYFKSLLETALSKTQSGCAAIMNNDGKIQIFNENKGTTLAKCWFSCNPYLTNFYNNSPQLNNLPARQNHHTQNLVCCFKCNAYYTISSLKLNNNRYYCGPCLTAILTTHAPPKKDNILPFVSSVNIARPNQFLSHIINPDLINIYDLI